MSPADVISDNPRDNELMFKLLSLDATRKLYSLIGLAIEDDAGLVRAVRDALGDVKSAEAPQARVDRVFAFIQERLGDDAAEVVRRWAATAFHHAYRAKDVYGYWIPLLAQCRWQPDSWQRLSLPDDHRENFMAHFLNAQDEETFTAAYDAAAAAPLSEWDLEMRLNNAFHDAESDASGPEILLGSLASVERNRRFWQWVVRALTPAQVEELHASAKALVRDTPQFSFIDDLRHPAALASPVG